MKASDSDIRLAAVRWGHMLAATGLVSHAYSMLLDAAGELRDAGEGTHAIDVDNAAEHIDGLSEAIAKATGEARKEMGPDD